MEGTPRQEIDLEVPFRLRGWTIVACLLGGAIWFLALVGFLTVMQVVTR